jgi:hypothetical protein
MTCKWYPVCPIKRFHEAGLLDDGWVDRYCKGPLRPECVRYRMEEHGTPHPDWMLPDGTLDERLRNT